MKILHLNASDVQGGAARAAYRLHRGLRDSGVDSQMLVQEKFSDDTTVVAPKIRIFQGIARARASCDALPLKLYSQQEGASFSLQWLPDRIVPKVAQLHPDIIHLHWIGDGFLQIETLAKFQRPIIWTLHDMWAFTGGCHYSGSCDRYITSCGACPQLQSNHDWDFSRWVWQRKAKTWKNLNLTAVTPSLWLAECVQKSSLFRDIRVEAIPNGLDTQKYKPINRQLARAILNLPQDRQLVLFGASFGTGEKRKGFHFLQAALQNLNSSGWQDKFELVIFGASQPNISVDFSFKTYYMGHLKDDISLALVYSAADVMVVPSVQESFGQTASESMACGTPVVAFNTTGLKDIVEHQKNGYLAQPYDVEDLAQGVAWVLGDKERHETLCYFARSKVEQEFTVDKQVERYLSLYHDIVNNKNNHP